MKNTKPVMSKEINLDLQLEYKGYWYLPSAPEYKVAGVVTYYPNDKIILELIGAFDDDLHNLFINKKESIILGDASDSKKISLSNCYQSSSLNFSSGIPIVRYTCNSMIIGKHIESLEQKCQYSLAFRFPELSYWCHPSAIDSTIHFREDGECINRICLSFDSYHNNDKDIIKSVAINEDIIVSLKRGIDYDSSTYFLRPQLQQYTYVEIDRKSPCTLSELLSDMYIYKDFMSLAALSELHSSDITFYDKDLYQQCGEKKFYKPIHYIQAFYDRNNHKEKNDFLFKYNSIKGIYSDIIKAWYNLPSDMYPIRKHLIDSLKKKTIYGSTDFLIIIQAIDGFWWRFKDEKYRQVNNIPRKVKTSLNTILDQLVTEFNDIELLIQANIDIEAVVDSRHYYSHFVPLKKKPKTLDGIELFKESRKIRILLMCCILSFMGVDNSHINAIFNNSELKLL